MKDYIGVKAVKAKAMTLGEYYQAKGIPVNDEYLDEGYMVEYPDGYRDWSFKEQFENAYLELTLENKISEEDIDRFIGNGAISHDQIDEKTTLVKMVPRTGFVQYEVSSCVDPANYDHELGVSIATGRLRNKLWPMLGFVLQWARYGLRQ